MAPGSASVCVMVILIAAFFQSAAAQAKATDPVEVEALKALGSRIGLSPPWTFDGVDPCLNGSDATGWGDIGGASNFQSSRGIECDCNISNDTFCHVIKLAIVDMRVAGQIAPEIGNLSYLLDLNFQANLITGVIPEELGLLRRMTYMTVASNQLSGTIPRSIGNLANLLTLSIAVNNFSGSLPKEIGNLTSLTEIYMDSSGLGGELPQELVNLQSLKTLNMFDNNFNGTIPAFLSNLSSLETLAMFGNQYNGPIPTSFANLQNLKTLEIGDIRSGGVIPPEFNRLQNLTKLSLRNCELSGSIPELGNLSKLEELDLSYNNLTGSVPISISTIPLKRLFLGSNNLTGTLPARLDSLIALDVSFNHLSGTVPSTINNINTISNQFVANQSPDSDEFLCLQSMSNCGRKNVGFAINCGGKEIVVDGTPFSGDMTSFGNGTGRYYSGQTWAVAGSGFADSFKVAPQWFQSIGGTAGEETTLYQDARTAPTSLSYFGLGMKDGPYTVRLYFSEIVMGIGSDGPGLGRRFFDVYIQGDRKLRDFNIRTEANGSLKAVVKTFKVNSSNGIIDIHLLWKGKGTCCAPFRSYGPLISAIKVSHDLEGNVTNSKGSDSRRKKIAIGVALGTVGIVAVVSLLLWRRRAQYVNLVDQDLRSLDGKLHIFPYNEIRTATRNFAEENLLGKGGFGSVYKGELRDGTIIAIKQLFAVKSHQSTREFVNEATLISNIQHRNLVKLLGCCVDGEHRILVLEFLENNSLYHALLSSGGPRLHLDWPTRFNICLGIAKGLAYLHEELSPRIIHRDIKATNVLLDKTLTPKIADFGLAKLFDDQQSHISTRVAGTLGYLAPEYAMRGQLTEKADVYSFGILTLEVLSGRPSIDTKREDMVYLIDYAWHLYETDQVLELLDKTVEDFDEEQVTKVIRVALLCSQALPGSRPTMTKVVAMLNGSEAVDVSSLTPGQFSAVEIAKFPKSKTHNIKEGDSSSQGTDSPWRGSSSKSIEPR